MGRLHILSNITFKKFINLSEKILPLKLFINLHQPCLLEAFIKFILKKFNSFKISMHIP